MPAADKPALDFVFVNHTASASCRIVLSGVISVESGKAVLNRLWRDPAYNATQTAVWDVSRCELPGFDALRQIAVFSKKEKAGRGPAIIAFVSPEFSTSILARALRGFQRLVSFKLNFFASETAAQTWLDERHQHHD